MHKKFAYSLAIIVPCLALASCGRAGIQGMVVDINGEAVPGAAVMVLGTDYYTHTDGTGRYTIGYAPGHVELRFAKSGYTPGRLVMDVAERRQVKATQVLLWCLPPSPGVHFFEKGQFTQIIEATPKRYLTKERGVFFAIPKRPPTPAPSQQPVIVCYKMPAYDVAMSKLDPVRATSNEEESAGTEEDVWASGASVPVSVIPVDDVDKLLFQVSYSEALAPGLYAIHWGSLKGHAATNPNAYIFEVAGPNPPPPEQAAPVQGADKKPQDQQQKPPKKDKDNKAPESKKETEKLQSDAQKKP